eukprot:1145219-Pelagomonas_calceolata.AAC.11
MTSRKETLGKHMPEITLHLQTILRWAALESSPKEQAWPQQWQVADWQTNMSCPLILEQQIIITIIIACCLIHGHELPVGSGAGR